MWDGNYYALEGTSRLGLEGSGGMVCVGPVRYNTVEEIRRFGEDCGRLFLPIGVTHRNAGRDKDDLIEWI